MTRALASLAAIATTGLAIAGCGGGSSSGSEAGYGGSSTSQPAAATATGAVVSAAVTPKLGKAIVDSEGLTLYDFHRDKGLSSSCYGGCARVWPPLLTKGKPRAGEGAIASKLGTTRRKDGTVQVTYAGHPLYTYVQDTEPGETSGNGTTSFGAAWYALGPTGRELGG